MLNAIFIYVVSYLRASSASVLFSFDNIRSKIIGKMRDIYIYMESKETNYSRECTEFIHDTDQKG